MCQPWQWLKLEKILQKYWHNTDNLLAPTSAQLIMSEFKSTPVFEKTEKKFSVQETTRDLNQALPWELLGVGRSNIYRW